MDLQARMYVATLSMMTVQTLFVARCMNAQSQWLYAIQYPMLPTSLPSLQLVK